MKPRQVFLYFACLFTVGIAIKTFCILDLLYFFIMATLGVILAVIYWSNKWYRYLFLGAIFLFLGAWRFNLATPILDDYNLAFYNNSQIEFSGQILTEPEITEKNIKLKIKAQELFSTSGKKEIAGKILVNVEKYGLDWQDGDNVFIRCKIEPPGVIKSDDEYKKDFDYGKYLLVEHIRSVCYQPLVIKKINEQENKNILIKINRALIKARQKFKTIIDTNLSLPASGLLNAMLLNYRREITPELSLAFNKTGLTHIIAISGLNITLIATMLFELFVALGVKRKKVFWLAMLILTIYVLMIGAPASAARALIMSGIFLYALSSGRLSFAFNALMLAAVILLLINPYALIYDIGFQLSFLAVWGLMLFYEKISDWLKFFPDKFQIRSLLTMTLAAQILTLPVIIYYFGRVSLIAPVANILVVPVLSIMTLAGFALIGAGLIFGHLAFIVGIVLHVIMSYIIKVVEILSLIPGGSFTL